MAAHQAILKLGTLKSVFRNMRVFCYLETSLVITASPLFSRTEIKSEVYHAIALHDSTSIIYWCKCEIETYIDSVPLKTANPF